MITAEEREWFYRAVAASTSGEESDSKKIREGVAIVRDAGADEDAVRTALEDLIDRCEQRDNAGDMLSIGGADALVGVVWEGRGKTRALAARALAVATQNHRDAQTRAANAGAVQALLNVVRTDGDEECLGSALWALSCIIRDCPEAAKAFEEAGGAEVVAKIISKPTGQVPNRVLAKALNLGKHAFVQSERNMSDAIEHGAVPGAVTCVNSADINVQEAAATLLLLIAQCVDFEKNPKAADQFHNGAPTIDMVHYAMCLVRRADKVPIQKTLHQLLCMLGWLGGPGAE